MKNLIIYKLKNTDFDLSKLQKFEPPLSLEFFSSGFVDPRDTGIFHKVGNNVLLRFRADKKILPKSAIDSEVMIESEAIYRLSGHKPSKNKLKELKKYVIDELLPSALCSSSYTNVWIDLKNLWLAIDTSSQNKSDDIIHAILKEIEGFPVESLTIGSVSDSMTNWLKFCFSPDWFSIDSDATLQKFGDEKSIVKYTNHTVSDDEILTRIAEGKICTSLAMTWNNKISFVLTDNLTIKKIKFLGLMKANIANSEDFDSEFTLMAMEFNAMLNRLFDALNANAEFSDDED